eukprot:c11259_g1_i3.p1 GENE.c11259_g1_i3~~c11259_g1_i3.p1  ORF type:complete len:193 (+),score=54.57 c11259_g1_i3:70-648(+)
MAQNGRHLIVERLLQAGCDITHAGQNGLNALHMAAIEGSPQVMMVLLAAVKDPRDLSIGAATPAFEDERVTPLHFAATGGHLFSVRALIEKGANVSAETLQGHTALDLAHLALADSKLEEAENEANEENEETDSSGDDNLGEWLSEEPKPKPKPVSSDSLKRVIDYLDGVDMKIVTGKEQAEASQTKGKQAK